MNINEYVHEVVFDIIGRWEVVPDYILEHFQIDVGYHISPLFLSRRTTYNICDSDGNKIISPIDMATSIVYINDNALIFCVPDGNTTFEIYNSDSARKFINIVYTKEIATSI